VPRAVLDTNVLVSGLISPGGSSARLLIELRAGAFELVVSSLLLAELGEVLRREKFRRYVSAVEVDAYLEFMRSESIVFDDPEPSPSPVGSDPDDEFLFVLARSARVDVLVSGNARVLDLRDRLPVLSPAEFLASLTGP
jgi:hypothetical protein